MTTDETPFDQPSSKSANPDNAAYSFDNKPDRWKRYRLPHPETGKADGFTRATTFAKSISDAFTLSQWSQRMVGLGLVLRHDLYMSFASTPADDREKLNQLAEQAKEAAGAKVGANLGTAIHSFTEMVDRGESPVIPAPYRPHVAAWSALLEEYGLEILDIERVVLCTEYDSKGVAGTLDRVVRFTRDVTVEVAGGKTHTFRKGTVAIVDLKTGKDLEYGWMEIAVQLAVYARAQHRWDKTELRWLPQFEGMDTDLALVIHIPATAPGETVTASMYAVNIAQGHEIAQLCTQVREARKMKGLATKLAVVHEQAVSALPDVTGGMPLLLAPPARAITAPETPSWEQRVEAAKTEADLGEIWLAAMAKREDTQALYERIVFRRRAILADTAAG
jgi:hypothetical protein